MLNFIAVTTDKLNIVQELAKRIWQAHYPDIISQAQIDYMLHKMYSTDALQAQLDSGHQFYLIENENKMAGFFSVGKNQSNEVSIYKLYIENTDQRTGIGTAAMNYIFSKFGNGFSYRLTVNRQNFKAINFYFKNGFRIEKVADFEIGQGFVMNDFVMVKHS